mmetsp:Transcript_76970/g.152439  ORF Transcript_76970/g.152439 Transcript_76970/m.152439 type:complete len:246 (-) Transcript_76970:23-760(-)
MTTLTIEYIKHVTGEFDADSVFQALLPNLGIARIDAVNQCCNLRWLDLSHNAIIRMENLEGLNQLVCIDLSFNKIQKVQNLEGMQSLERLKLMANPISRLQDLAGLKPAGKLQHLNFRNIDGTDFCPVCLQDGYQRTVRELCPSLVALDSRRWAHPNLEEEVRRFEEGHQVSLPEPEPWFGEAELALDILRPDTVTKALQPHLDKYEAALADCQEAFREADELLRLQDLPAPVVVQCSDLGGTIG